jgi:hypothetical protein
VSGAVSAPSESFGREPHPLEGTLLDQHSIGVQSTNARTISQRLSDRFCKDALNFRDVLPVSLRHLACHPFPKTLWRSFGSEFHQMQKQP